LALLSEPGIRILTAEVRLLKTSPNEQAEKKSISTNKRNLSGLAKDIRGQLQAIRWDHIQEVMLGRSQGRSFPCVRDTTGTRYIVREEIWLRVI
jgi:hypothetical protein